MADISKPSFSVLVRQRFRIQKLGTLPICASDVLNKSYGFEEGAMVPSVLEAHMCVSSEGGQGRAKMEARRTKDP